MANKEGRQITRVLKTVRRYRSVIKPHHLERLFKVLLPSVNIPFNTFEGYSTEFKETFDLPKSVLAKLAKIPEVEYYLRTLVVILLFREGRFEDAQRDARENIEKIYDINRRSLDPLNAILYYYYARAN